MKDDFLSKISIISFSDRSTTAPNGTVVYGNISEEIASELDIPAGEIRLLNGFENSSNKGFGLAHINAKESRKKTITGLGFRDVSQMVYQTCSGYDSIHKGENDRQILVKSHLSAKSKLVLLEVVIEWNEEREFWHVITALPTATVRQPKIWSKSEE